MYEVHEVSTPYLISIEQGVVCYRIDCLYVNQETDKQMIVTEYLLEDLN